MIDSGQDQPSPMSLRLVEISNDGKPLQDVPMEDLVTSVCQSVWLMYGQTAFVPPWIGYLAILDGKSVGTCAFKAPPKGSHVEIAYFTFPGFEGRGIATAMAQRLVEIARMNDPGIFVVAQTLPEENASTRILRKLGFALRGTVIQPEDGQVWEWELASGSKIAPS